MSEKKSSSKKRIKNDKLKLYVAYGLFIFIVFLLFIILVFLPDFKKLHEEDPVIDDISPSDQLIEDYSLDPIEDDRWPVPDPKPARKVLVFIIDDVGNSLYDLDHFLKFQGPITFAVMPFRPYTHDSVSLIQKAGKEIIIHQPMEAFGAQNPGVSAIYLDHSRDDVYSILSKNLRDIPGAVGMNNHMGSAITSDIRIMQYVLQFLDERNLFFLDSYTTVDSIVKSVSQEMKIPYFRRNSMFLDNDTDRDSMIEAIEEGLTTAKKHGHAVMIGHVMTRELAEILIELYPRFIEEGYTLKELSQFVLANEEF